MVDVLILHKLNWSFHIVDAWGNVKRFWHPGVEWKISQTWQINLLQKYFYPIENIRLNAYFVALFWTKTPTRYSFASLWRQRNKFPNCLHKANYRWCDVSLKGQFVFLPGLHVEEFLSLHCSVINQQVNFQPFFSTSSCKPFFFSIQFFITTLPDKATPRINKIEIFLSGK